MKKELLKGLNEEQIAKIKACKNQEDILNLAKAEGIELSQEQLAAISGGGCVSSLIVRCPNCKSDSFFKLENNQYKCMKCGTIYKHN